MLLTTDQEQKKLLAAWRLLEKEERRTVRLFAEFLTQQTEHNRKSTPPPDAPLTIPKPKKESAVFALKRLKQTYPMIEADLALLDEASQLLLKKIMGSTDEEVIDELEQLFKRRYQTWQLNNSDQKLPPDS